MTSLIGWFNRTPKRGDMIVDPRDKKTHVTVLAYNLKGVCYKHPKKGICGLRFDSMTPEELALVRKVVGREYVFSY